MYLCYYNCILTKAQGQLIITPSISNLHKPILFKDSMFGGPGLPYWLWKSAHQTAQRPSKGIKGVVCSGLLSTLPSPPRDRQRIQNRSEEAQWAWASPWGHWTKRAQFPWVTGESKYLAQGWGNISVKFSSRVIQIHSAIHTTDQ